MAKVSLNTIAPAPIKPAQEDPTLWTNKQAMLFARKKGWNYKDRKALHQIATEMGLDLHVLTVPAALIRSIAAVLQANGGL